VVVDLNKWLWVKRFIAFIISLVCLGQRLPLALVVRQEFPVELRKEFFLSRYVRRVVRKTVDLLLQAKLAQGTRHQLLGSTQVPYVGY